jgi:hypothetical protein
MKEKSENMKQPLAQLYGNKKNADRHLKNKNKDQITYLPLKEEIKRSGIP